MRYNKMKRKYLLLHVLSFVLLVGMVVTLTSCSAAKLKRSKFSDEESIGPAVFSASDITSTGLTLEITNTSTEYGLEYFRDERRGYDNGHGFRLEQKIDDDWYVMNVIIDDTSIDTDCFCYIIEHGKSKVLELSWSYLYGELSPGEYRMLFRLSLTDGFDYDQYIPNPVYVGDFYIPIEFEIK
jgi:hypothetical protein